MDHQKEEILEAIWAADEHQETSILSIQKHCKNGVVNKELVEELKTDELIRQEDVHLYLTPKGKDLARQITRRHRLTECLMGYVLHLDPDTMERVACETEHTLLPEVEESICTLLGHPEIAPDGTTVPPGTCCTKGTKQVEKTISCISDLEPGSEGKIAYIRSKSHDRMQQLASFGIVPGIQIRVEQKSPAYCLLLENTEIALDSDIARDIFVWRM
ncbi:MAG: metal-dependent transcriptional regulator [Fibrobacteria bacterium]|nr:metal-dependent transcriptional regulator [Fibrobacteria bacterium]